MLSFTFSLDQLRQAPPEVQHWFENELARSLRGLTEAQHEPVGPSTELAACTIEEALGLLQLIKGDFAATQVFLELAREIPIGTGPSPLHALSIGQIKLQLRLNDEQLVDALGVINQAFQQIRNNADATLFGFDQANHVYVHETTHRSIRSLWENLVRLSSKAQAPAADVPHPFGFVPPVVGPSEDVPAH